MARVLERLMPYLLIAPALIFLAAFFLVPLAEALLVSFRSSGGPGASRTMPAPPPTSISARRCATR